MVVSKSIAHGALSGFNSFFGNGNVFIGYKAGYNEFGNNKLYLSDDSTKTIIYGDISTCQILLGKPDPYGNIFKGTRTLNVK